VISREVLKKDIDALPDEALDDLHKYLLMQKFYFGVFDNDTVQHLLNEHYRYMEGFLPHGPRNGHNNYRLGSAYHFQDQVYQ